MKDPEGGANDPITVEHTPKKKLDLFPRIVCLLVALGIWIFMVNMNDPNSSETFTLKLDLVGATNIVSEDGTPLTVVGMDKSEVTITVKGTNRDLKSFAKGEYRATVDVSAVKKTGDITIPVKITTPAGSSINLVSSDITEVTLSIDLVTEKDIPFSVFFAEDSVPAEGVEYEVQVLVGGNDISTLDNKIRIKGPKSVVDHITGATYTVKHGEQTNSYLSILPTYTVDSADPIDTSRVICSDISVAVKAFSERTKTIELVEVRDVFEYVISSETTEITVKGDPKFLDSVDKIVLLIPTVEFIEGDGEAVFELNKLLRESKYVDVRAVDPLATITVSYCIVQE